MVKPLMSLTWLRVRVQAGVGSSSRLQGCAGQTTAEYALVLVGAAAIASLLIAWATGTDSVGKLMDFVIAHVIGSVR